MPTHLPGLQFEVQTQLGVVNGSIAPQLCQGQLEVRHSLLGPVNMRGLSTGALEELSWEGWLWVPHPSFSLCQLWDA